MKKVLFFALSVVIGLTSCSSNTYSKLLNKEKKQIKYFMNLHSYRLTNQWPEEEVWDDNLYYIIPGYDNLYFHLIKQGPKERITGSGDAEEIESVQATETVVIRYRKYTLTEPSDTISYWSTLDSAYPVEFQFLTDYTNACVGWHAAVGLMGYTGSECYVICPSKCGFSDDQNTVTPYGYHLKMQVKR